MECPESTGTLSYEQFLEGIKAFYDLSSKNGDVWQIEQVEDGVYLTRKETHTEEASESEFGCDPEMECDANVSCIDPAVLCLPMASRAIVVDYHITYSHSYAVPVLYFNMRQSSGKLLSLDEVWKKIPSAYNVRTDGTGEARSPWTVVTQQEHPYRHIPYFVLHPCHTADLMKHASRSSLDDSCDRLRLTSAYSYLVRWLSTVGPLVGLRLPWYFAKATPAETTRSGDD